MFVCHHPRLSHVSPEEHTPHIGKHWSGRSLSDLDIQWSTWPLKIVTPLLHCPPFSERFFIAFQNRGTSKRTRCSYFHNWSWTSSSGVTSLANLSLTTRSEVTPYNMTLLYIPLSIHCYLKSSCLFIGLYAASLPTKEYVLGGPQHLA